MLSNLFLATSGKSGLLSPNALKLASILQLPLCALISESKKRINV